MFEEMPGLTTKSLLLIIVLMAIGYASSAQTFSVSGTMIDSTAREPLPGVAVVLRSVRDTTQWKGTLTDIDGNFRFENVAPGGYRLKATYIGYTTRQRFIRVRGENIEIGPLMISQSAVALKAVEVTDTQIRVQQKGDTLQYNANAFKTSRDGNVEDLITKMPGITVDGSGVKAQGENVQQILVDGKPFFGDDPNITLKNLPAEVIDKIEVFDRLSEQAQFTGFDDGQTRKTINIVTKKGVSRGDFGKIYAGAGENGRYIAGGNMNAFKGARKLSAIGLTNNINQQNFSNEDLLGISGNSTSSGGGRGGRGGGRTNGGGNNNNNSSNFQVGQQSGISTTHAMGLNYSNEWKKVELSGSYFFNKADNDRRTSLERTFIAQRDSGLVYTERNRATSTNFNHRLNLRLEYEIDSANSLVVTPAFSQQRNRSQSNLGGDYLTSETQERHLDNGNYGYNTGYNFSNNVLFRHRFKKRGRSASINATVTLNDRDADSGLRSVDDDFLNDTTVRIDQHADQITSSDTYSSNVAFTEPIGKSGQFQVNYTLSLTKSSTSKQTFDINPETGANLTLDTLLTNVFENTYLSNRGGASYRYNKKRFNFMTGLNFQYADLASTQDFPQPFELQRSFENLLPQAMLNYKFSQGANLRFNYRTATNAPTVSQLQNVVNNRNPLFLRSGNSNLKQDYQHTFTLRYGRTNFKTASSFNVFLFANYVKDYIGNATFRAEKDTTVNGVRLSQRGTQLTYPINVPENWNARTFITFGVPMSAIKSNLNLNTGFNYNRTPALINGRTNLAHNYSLSEGIVLGSNHEAIDFTVSYTANYVIVKNTLQTSSDNNYFTHLTSLRLTWQPWKGIVFNSNLVNTVYTGLGEEFNQSIWFWNAAIGYKLLKDKSLDIRISGFDLLNQNRSINRDVTETYIEDSQTNALTRYYMLMITYDLRKFK
ncbi:TonB-dependent receptor [Fulvivirgaceae bacterium PWU4]|uniref:TonB-dependent receptor n=1 Tax=Chryseosolibacter histidini TaxID=2782349 RepID=A0AAP2DLQ8_9BACT|nr:TonB-dependent receptor [Chryseosolibacter histidini]MBT1697603.1 TonB-dependent receptor [Chryseosolibacter histidini]